MPPLSALAPIPGQSEAARDTDTGVESPGVHHAPAPAPPPARDGGAQNDSQDSEGVARGRHEESADIVEKKNFRFSNFEGVVRGRHEESADIVEEKNLPVLKEFGTGVARERQEESADIVEKKNFRFSNFEGVVRGK